MILKNLKWRNYLSVIDKKVSTPYKNDEYDNKFKKLMEMLKDD